MTIVLIICLAFIAVVGLGIVFGGAPWVPTRRSWAQQALKLAQVGAGDVVIDLGSGDGVVLAEACRRGAKRSIGYEINPLLVVWSRWRLRRYHKQAVVYDRDFFRANLPADTTVIYLFGVGRMMNRLAEYLTEQRPKLTAKTVRVVSFGFDIPGLKPVVVKDGFNLYEI